MNDFWSTVQGNELASALIMEAGKSQEVFIVEEKNLCKFLEEKINKEKFEYITHMRNPEKIGSFILIMRK